MPLLNYNSRGGERRRRAWSQLCLTAADLHEMKVLKETHIFRTYRIAAWSLMFLMTFGVASCLDDEEFTSSPDVNLYIYRDTVRLGTIISGDLAATDTVKIYNHHKKGVRINRVWLEQGAASPFRVNFDGRFLSAGQGESFEALGNDSLFAFISFLSPETDSDEEVEYVDRLYIELESGNISHVPLKASVQSVNSLKAERIRADKVFDSPRPYRILDSLVVEQGATLTLAAGVRLYFHPGASLIVHGKLVSEGTPERNVILRGDRLGNMLSQVSYDNIANQWEGIRICSESYGNILRHTDIHSANFGIHCEPSSPEEQKLVLESCKLHNFSEWALKSQNSWIYAVNTQITNAAAGCVEILGGNASFVHCTIAQFYAVLSAVDGPALHFANYHDAERLPLLNLQFNNCIITGRHDDDIMGEQNTSHPEDDFNYLFRHCLLNTPKVVKGDGAAFFENCLWEEDGAEGARAAGFEPTFDYDQLIFNFQLSPRSRALGIADPAVSASYAPLDRLGIDRLADGSPDAGCYERQ